MELIHVLQSEIINKLIKKLSKVPGNISAPVKQHGYYWDYLPKYFNMVILFTPVGI